MQTLASVCLGVAAMAGAFLMSTLWYMASTGGRPAWLQRMAVNKDTRTAK